MTAKVWICGGVTTTLAVVLGMVGLVGCGAQPEIDPQPATSATPSSSAPTPSESAEVTATPTATETADAPTEDPTDPSDPTEEDSERPPVLDEKATGRDLTMSDFFSAPEEWQDGRFQVAGRRDLAGISGPLYYCRDDQSTHDVLELRLANQFKRISMKIGQSDESEQSDAMVNVRLLGNGKYIDSVKVPFNKIDEFSASVSDVNALKIEVWIGGDKCEDGGKKVGAVLTGLRLE